MEPKKITKEIYRIGGADLTSAKDCAVYLLDLGELVLIDIGSGEGFDKLIDNIEKAGFRPQDISTMIMTHCHVDHIGGAGAFREHFGTRLIMHALDSEIVERADMRLTAALCFNINFQPLAVDTKLMGEKGIITIGRHQISWLRTPGHTPGSISVYVNIDGKRILFPQDIAAPLLKEFDCDPAAWMESINKLLALDADILCDGHSGAYGPKNVVKDYLEYCIDSQRQMGYITL
ncbi:MAG: MBL fold metallo-hydrolase [Proteobacteria bacterium]|nr:MBL fold metallo-hydrolase [Pseudomonadota bacterium]